MIIKKAESLEVTLDNTNTRFYFEDKQVLRNKRITGILTYRAAEMTNTPKNKTACTDTGWEKAFLVLTNTAGEEVISRVPVTAFNQKDNAGNVPSLAGLVVDWPRSYFEFAAVLGSDNGNGLAITVIYED